MKKNNSIVKVIDLILFYIIIFIFVLFPFGQLTRISFNSNIAFYVHDIFAACAFFLFITRLLFRKYISGKSKIRNNIFAFISVAIISLLFASLKLQTNEFLISFLYLVRWIIYSSLYFVILLFPFKRKQVIHKLLLGSGSLFAFFGLLQYFLYPNLRNLYYAGWDPHLSRVFSTFFDPNFAGIYLVLTLFLFLSRVLTAKKNIVEYLLIIIISLALLLTYSRSSYLSFIIGVLILAVFVKKRAFGVIVVSLFILGLFLLPRPFGEGVRLERIISSFARIESWKEALFVFEKNPIFGVGFNAYRFKRFTQLTNTIIPSHSASGVDNSFLFVLATTGIAGFASYLFLWLKILKQSIDEKNIKYKLIRFSTISAIIIHSLFLNTLFYPWIMIWTWGMLGSTEY